MSRLEIAFTAVTQTVGATATVPPSGLDTQQQMIEPAVVPEPAEVSKLSTVEPLPEVQKVAPERTASGFASLQQTSVPEAPVDPSVSGFSANKAEPVTEPVVKPVPAPVHEPEPVSAPVVPPVAEPIPNEEAVPAEPISERDQSSAPNTGGIMSVAKEKQIQDLMTTEKLAATTTNQQRQAVEIAAMDPLMRPEVTNGLHQLLSEWSLFKSSGIFGTGPSGIDHQLYLKLAALNMTAVVAGRFEGATPAIKRSITDYMNGWRYEEGIMQEQGELFEHYLRRVIRHIIDKRSNTEPKK